MGEGFTEDIKVTGEQLLAKVKELLHETNIRSITIKDKDGKEILVIPLSVGIIGGIFVPQLATLAAVGTVAALLTDCTITIERKNEPSVAPPPVPPEE
jgi:hypothetical protein